MTALSAGMPGGGATLGSTAWMPEAAMIFCAAGEIMNRANSFAAFGLFASLRIAVGEDTMNAPSVG